MLPEGKVKSELLAPEADNSRFPLVLNFNGKSYRTYWKYSNRDKARLFYQTRSHLLAEPLFKLKPGKTTKVDFMFVGARVAHPGTNDIRDLLVSSPKTFGEIGILTNISNKLPSERYYAGEKAKWYITATDGPYIAYNNGIVEDTHTGLEWVGRP